MGLLLLSKCWLSSQGACTDCVFSWVYKYVREGGSTEGDENLQVFFLLTVRSCPHSKVSTSHYYSLQRFEDMTTNQVLLRFVWINSCNSFHKIIYVVFRQRVWMNGTENAVETLGVHWHQLSGFVFERSDNPCIWWLWLDTP